LNTQSIAKFKTVVNLKLNYCCKSLIPFEYLLDEKVAWKFTVDYLKIRLTSDNFWIIYLIIDILYEGRSNEVVVLFIEKII
jgi:hypothetical protein